MLATNIAEWLSVVVEETKHEIHHLHSIDKHHNGLNFHLYNFLKWTYFFKKNH